MLALQLIVMYKVARMFMQKTACKRGKATYFTFLVRQSFRTPEGPRSRTVCNVTKLPPHIRELIAQSQTIRLGRLEVKGQSLKIKVTRVPKDLNTILSKLGLLELFTQPPTWAPG